MGSGGFERRSLSSVRATMALEYHEGQTVILAPVEEADPIVGRWRREFDRTAAEGIPAHVSILFPFVPRSELSDATFAATARIADKHPRFDFSLAEVKRFPDGNIYLAPDPAAPFRHLTEAIWNRWPEHPPYGGEFPEIIPHLTVAIEPPDNRVAEIERSLNAALPVQARMTELELWSFEPGRWIKLGSFGLGGTSAA
jgi:2'-5' RNA ligase superfamily